MKILLLSALMGVVCAAGPVFAQADWEADVTVWAQLTVSEESCGPFLDHDKMAADMATARESFGTGVATSFVAAVLKAKTELRQMQGDPEFCEKAASYAAARGYASAASQ